MNDDLQPSKPDSTFLHNVSSDVTRKLRVQREGKQGVWFGLGMSGVIGWSVAAPTVGGVLLGLWLDQRHPGTHSWTLMLLVAGLCMGCANAWYWVAQQDRAMHDEDEDKHV